jgi:hypothetical protein
MLNASVRLKPIRSATITVHAVIRGARLTFTDLVRKICKRSAQICSLSDLSYSFVKDLTKV